MRVRLFLSPIILLLSGAAAQAQNMTSFTPAKVDIPSSCPLSIGKVQIENNGTLTKVGLLVRNKGAATVTFTAGFKVR